MAANAVVLPGTLTPERITELMGKTRNRGMYLPVLSDFFGSNAVAVDFTEKFPGKDAQALRNSVQNNLDKYTADKGWTRNVKILVGPLTDEEDAPKHCILVNLDAHAAALAAGNES